MERIFRFLTVAMVAIVTAWGGGCYASTQEKGGAYERGCEGERVSADDSAGGSEPDGCGCDRQYEEDSVRDCATCLECCFTWAGGSDSHCRTEFLCDKRLNGGIAGGFKHVVWHNNVLYLFRREECDAPVFHFRTSCKDLFPAEAFRVAGLAASGLAAGKGVSHG